MANAISRGKLELSDLKLPKWLDKLIAPVRDLWHQFKEDNGTVLAAAISFYVFLSLVPLLLVAIAIFGLILGSEHHAQSVIKSITEQYVVGESAKPLMEQITRGSGIATGIGLFLLLWSGTSAFVGLQNAINIAWNIDIERSHWKQRLFALAMLAFIGVLVLVSIGITSLVGAVESRSVPVLSHLSWLWKIVGYTVPLLVSIAIFTFIYKFFPNTNVKWNVALVSGIFAGVLWEIAKVAFTFYVTHFADYNKVYGGLGSIILLLVWINYSAVIAILGAELASSRARKQEQREQRDAS